MTRITAQNGYQWTSVGEQLRIAVPGKIEGGQPPITYTQQWHVNGRPVKGETSAYFTVREQDDLKEITCITTATDAIGRVLVLKPSNSILVGKNERCKPPARVCPPKPEPNCPEAPEIERRNRQQPSKPVSRTRKGGTAPVAKPSAVAKQKPSPAQLRREMEKARGGCKSCAERARARRRNKGL